MTHLQPDRPLSSTHVTPGPAMSRRSPGRPPRAAVLPPPRAPRAMMPPPPVPPPPPKRSSSYSTHASPRSHLPCTAVKSRHSHVRPPFSPRPIVMTPPPAVRPNSKQPSPVLMLTAPPGNFADPGLPSSSQPRGGPDRKGSDPYSVSSAPPFTLSNSTRARYLAALARPFGPLSPPLKSHSFTPSELRRMPPSISEFVRAFRLSLFVLRSGKRLRRFRRSTSGAAALSAFPHKSRSPTPTSRAPSLSSRSSTASHHYKRGRGRSPFRDKDHRHVRKSHKH